MESHGVLSKMRRVGFSPREALASLSAGGAKAPRGLKPTLLP
jgi:hypothetical protein